jgi:hypothetical protein
LTKALDTYLDDAEESGCGLYSLDKL